MNEESCCPRKDGFFKGYYERLKSALGEDVMERFSALETDEDRIRFAAGIVYPDNKPVAEWAEAGKSAEEATRLKDSGNKAFARGDEREALRLYSESLTKVPYESSSIAFANRSACLYRMKEYELAIRDVDAALEVDYPRELRYKVLERKAKCCLALRKHDEAVAAFKNAIRALDDSKLTTEKKLKMQTDIQIMLGMLAKAKVERTSREIRDKDGEKLCSPRHPVYLSSCDKIDVVEAPVLGRYAVAAADILPGEVLLVENAACSVLLSEFTRDHCLHCFKRPKAPYPCTACSCVVFCGKECRKAAEETYHRYECAVSPTVYASGASVMVLMALRIVTQKPPEFFLRKRTSLADARKTSERYDGSDYETMYQLVRHEGERKCEDFFERSIMALFLLECLRRGRYLSESAELTDDDFFFGGLLLRHLQFLQFNAHEISELGLSKEEEDSRSVFIGGGLYPTLALFNHSCDPGVARYFRGSTVVVRAVRPIRRGDIVAENYGPMFTSASRDDRRAKLRSQYWFDCTCTPCDENWPLLRDMDPAILRFRCDSGTGCNGVIPVPHTADEFMARCPACGRFTNLLKGLKALQDTDAMYRQATRDVDAGNVKAALGIYTEILNTLDSVMAPPFRDYHVCQEALRKCMLRFGNTFPCP